MNLTEPGRRFEKETSRLTTRTRKDPQAQRTAYSARSLKVSSILTRSAVPTDVEERRQRIQCCGLSSKYKSPAILAHPGIEDLVRNAKQSIDQNNGSPVQTWRHVSELLGTLPKMYQLFCRRFLQVYKPGHQVICLNEFQSCITLNFIHHLLP